MNEKEIERRKRYAEKLQKLFEEKLAKENIEIVDEGTYSIKLKYKNVEFVLASNTDWNSWNKHYQVWIVQDNKTLATRCLLKTAITKAKHYIENKEE